MSQESVMNDIDCIIDFSETTLKNIPDQQTTQDRNTTLMQFQMALHEDFTSQTTISNALSGLKEVLQELDLLDKQIPQLQEHIDILKKIISTLEKLELHILAKKLEASCGRR